MARFGRACGGALGLVTMLTTPGRVADAHEAFADCIWHRVQMNANARHLDIIVELTFFETWSARERERMDANRDGRLQRSEVEHHAAQLERSLVPALSLEIAGRRVPLVALYAPEINLLGHDSITGGHHQLRLRIFATLPVELPEGASVTLESRLWPEARSLTEFSGAGSTGLEAQRTQERTLHPAADAPLRFTARFKSEPEGIARPRAKVESAMP